MLDGTCDSDDNEDDDEGDGAAVGPGPLGTSHGEGHCEEDPGGANEDEAEHVEGGDALAHGFALTGVDGGQEEDIDRGYHTTDDKVDVEGPAPCRARDGEAATDDRAKYGADAPVETDEGDVEPAFLGGGHEAEVVEAAEIDAGTTSAGENTADDEGVHVGGRSADDGPNLKRQDTGDE